MATKILISTDSHVLHTGLAETTRLIFYPLLDKYPGQYEICQIGLFHSNPITNPRWQIFPTRLITEANGSKRFDDNDRYGQLTFPEVVQKVRPDIVFGYGDPWYVQHMATSPLIKDYSLVLYLTYDGTPYPPNDQDWLVNADKLVTLSHFGKHVMKGSMPKLRGKDIDVVYSPADINRFTPASDEEKVQIRNNVLAPSIPRDAFILGWVGRNQWRKQVWKMYQVAHYIVKGDYLICDDCEEITPIDWDPAHSVSVRDGETLQSPPGFKFDRCVHCKSTRITKAEPIKDFYVWAHMAPEDRMWPVEWLHKHYDVESNVIYTPNFTRVRGMPLEIIPNLYRAWDGLLYLTGGEGFGNGQWEAMCAGIPVIYTNYSSHAELGNAGNAGIGIGGELQPEMNSCIWRMIADTSQTIKAIRKLYFDRALAKQLGANGRTYVSQFSPDKQAEKWHAIFQSALSPTRTMLPSVYAMQV